MNDIISPLLLVVGIWRYDEICVMYYVYILTNHTRNVLYIGVTNNLKRRLREHGDARGNPKSFTGKYYCNKLVYFEEFTSILKAIKREDELKRFTRRAKLNLIKSKNPRLTFIFPPEQ